MMPSSARNGSRTLLLVVAAAIPAFVAAVALGRPTIRQSFFNEYPNAVGSVLDSVPSHATHCGVCHLDFNGGGTRNPYGVRLGQVIGNYSNNDAGRRQAMRFIQDEDPDADTFSTLTEVTDETNYSNTPTFPGLTPANVASVTNVNPADLTGFLVPTAAPDTTPPAVSVVAPNGGESTVGNAAFNVQWTASDASGIGAVEIWLSDDNGASYRPLAKNLSNLGTFAVFLPNRPTTQARVRIVAIDNAGNAGQDDSNNVFAINAPPGGIAPTTLRDFDLPGTQPFGGGTLNDPSTCAACHGNYNTSVEPYFNWQGSMMAHASRDPLFEACMAVANQDAPDSGDLCLRCHIPAGWLGGRSVPTGGGQMLSADKHGVSCDLCHRMVDPVADPANPPQDAAILAALAAIPGDFANGMYVADPAGTRRGPFADASLSHPTLYSPFHREAALCGTCHDVSNPAFSKDINGNYPPNTLNAPPGTTSSTVLMPIERTYSEWLHSDYNTPEGVFAPQFGGNRSFVATCQDCHLRAVTGVGCNVAGAPTRTLLPLHDMTGGSAWLAGLLPGLFPSEVSGPAIEAGILRARYMLQNAATLSASQQAGQLLVTVTNDSGHKLPTGYPEGRRVWINVRFYDGTNALLSESGAYDTATGVLGHDPQVKIYEAKPGLDLDTAGLAGVSPGPSFHFVLNNKLYKDNRIPPRGFNNAAFAQFGGAPIGAAYADGQYWDDSLYSLPPSAVRAEIALYYQSTSKEYVEFLRDANTTNTKGQDLFNLWSANNRCPPELMETATVNLLPLAGDIDGDWDVDAQDAALFVNVLLGLDATPPYVSRSDLTGNGSADGADVQLFAAALLG